MLRERDVSTAWELSHCCSYATWGGVIAAWVGRGRGVVAVWEGRQGRPCCVAGALDGPHHSMSGALARLWSAIIAADTRRGRGVKAVWEGRGRGVTAAWKRRERGVRGRQHGVRGCVIATWEEHHSC